MASLLDLAQARLGGLLAPPQRPSMVGLLGGQRPQGTLASTIAGYTPPQMQAMSNQQVMDYARTVAQTAQQNLQTQMSDLDKALVMGQQGIQVGDKEALARLMEQVPGLMGATAYHGTPHTIRGKFDISKVGTGEGAQSYGHGMYFAESPTVAEFYKNTLKTKDQDIINNAIERLVYVNNKDTSKIADALKMEGFNLERITPELENSIKKIVQATDATTNTLSKAGINEYANLSKLVPEQGNLYKVDIPDEYIPNMLDWDKPINQQTAKVQEIARQLDPNLLADTPHLIVRGQPRHWTEVVDKIEDLQNPKVIKLLKKIYGESAEVMPYGDYLASKMTGQELYRNLSNPTQWSKEAAPYAMKAGMEDAAVSAKLNELGVKGIRYKDAMSRSADEGTSNFVVFDPSNVKILEQNSKPMTRKEIIEQELEKVAK